MYKVNLIRGWQSTIVYRKYRNQLILIMAIITFVFLVVYSLLFIRFLVLQKQLVVLSDKQYVSNTGQQYSTEELTKTLYSLKKLDQIKQVYVSYPEYVLYHRFLLNIILTFNSFTISNYTLNKEHVVNVALKTSNLNHIFDLIILLESPEISKYFSVLEINSVNTAKDKKEETTFYQLDLVLKFNEELLNEKAKF